MKYAYDLYYIKRQLKGWLIKALRNIINGGFWAETLKKWRVSHYYAAAAYDKAVEIVVRTPIDCLCA